MEKMEEHGVSILHELLQWNKSCARLLFCHDLKLNLSRTSLIELGYGQQKQTPFKCDQFYQMVNGQAVQSPRWEEGVYALKGPKLIMRLCLRLHLRSEKATPIIIG